MGGCERFWCLVVVHITTELSVVRQRCRYIGLIGGFSLGSIYMIYGNLILILSLADGSWHSGLGTYGTYSFTT